MHTRAERLLAVLTAVPVTWRALASFAHRHFSSDWDFARGPSFLAAYDGAFTYAPLLALLVLAWAYRRRSSAFAAYGLGLLLVALVGPMLVAGRVFAGMPVFATWLADPPFVAAVALASAAFVVTALAALRGPGSAAVRS